MSENRFKIFKWLVAIVALLLGPSVLLASLWISETREEVRRADRAVRGLEAIDALRPLVLARAMRQRPTGDHSWLDRTAPLFTDTDEIAALEAAFGKAAGSGTHAEGLRAIRALVRFVFRAAEIEAATPPRFAGVPAQVIDHALSAARASLSFVDIGHRLTERQELNRWDRMALPVQGGQYKAVSDEISRLAVVFVADLAPADRGRLEGLIEDYRAANGQFQGAAGRLVRGLGDVDYGDQIELGEIVAVYPGLVDANTELLFSLVESLTRTLKERSAALSSTVLATMLVCIVSILGALAAAIGVCWSLTKRTKRELADIGAYDPLTGLPNRSTMLLTLHRMIAESVDTQAPVAVFHIDLNRFKAINDALGVETGDALLRRVGAELAGMIEAEDGIARIAGDQFLVVSRRLYRKHDLMCFARSICDAVARPKRLNGEICRVTARMGVSAALARDTSADQLLLDAELALRSPAEGDGSDIRFFRDDMRQAFKASNATAQRLRKALDDGHVEPWFQPQVCISTGRVLGFEALVRWIDPERGAIPNGMFLPVAAEFDLGDDIDRMVRRKALKALNGWRKAGLETGHIGLNMTASHLSRTDHVDELIRDVEAAGVSPRQVSLEVLESVMLDETAAGPIIANLERLSAMGFFIELDDFGTGHAGLASLRDLKVNRVKIDRSFVSGVDTDPDLATLTNALIQLALSLDIEVLAEGVEREAERRWLRDHGCQVVQGYLVSKAIPDGAVADWCAAWHERCPRPDSEADWQTAAA
ncbi:MAG: bifunctional diguanylate cyclase/phosphodiesterase [Pseudomonadota bacterium]